MAYFSCDRSAKALELKAARKVLEAPAEPDHSPNVGGSGMADYSPYSIPNPGINPDNLRPWRSLGELAAELVRKAGAQ